VFIYARGVRIEGAVVILDVLVRPSAHGELCVGSGPLLSASDPAICSANVP